MPSERILSRIERLLDQVEILVSDLLKALTESSGEFTFGAGRQVELKGISGAQTVHPIEWR